MDKKLIIKSARVAIKSEISGIKKLSTVIDDNFSKILIKLSKVKGKIIFTGVGKSAHIAQKISSTMSSTGTPSQFYHSTEMSHGDLGAISKNDLIIILSNSGNSVELNGIIFVSKILHFIAQQNHPKKTIQDLNKIMYYHTMHVLMLL